MGVGVERGAVLGAERALGTWLPPSWPPPWGDPTPLGLAAPCEQSGCKYRSSLDYSASQENAKADFFSAFSLKLKKKGGGDPQCLE